MKLLWYCDLGIAALRQVGQGVLTDLAAQRETILNVRACVAEHQRSQRL